MNDRTNFHRHASSMRTSRAGPTSVTVAANNGTQCAKTSHTNVSVASTPPYLGRFCNALSDRLKPSSTCAGYDTKQLSCTSFSALDAAPRFCSTRLVGSKDTLHSVTRGFKFGLNLRPYSAPSKHRINTNRALAIILNYHHLS